MSWVLAARLEGGELRIASEPGIPAGDERWGLALTSEDAVEVAACDAKLRGCRRRSGEADERAFGLVWDGGHGFLLDLFRGLAFAVGCVAATNAATKEDLASTLRQAR